MVYVGFLADVPVTTPGVPSAGRGQPAFDSIAAEAIAAARGHPRSFTSPYGGQPPDWDTAAAYERAELSEEERAEAARAKEQAALVCRLCGTVHVLPNAPACPRLLSFELAGDGSVKAGTFRTDRKWIGGIAVPAADMYEKEGGDGG